MFNGLLLGKLRRPQSFKNALRKMRRHGKIGNFVSVFVNQKQRFVYIASNGSRICRPLVNTDKSFAKPLLAIKVEEPTVKMAFAINTSPFVGREGKYVTSRNLRDRLYCELERNLAMKVEDGETADTFIVSGRDTLHITILIKKMRREGFEFMVGPPKVINKRMDDKLLEPYEITTVEVSEDYRGSIVEFLGRRREQMFDMQGVGSEGTTFLKYKIPSRGILELRNAILTATRGTTILNTVFTSYEPWAGDITTRELGSLVVFDPGGPYLEDEFGTDNELDLRTNPFQEGENDVPYLQKEPMVDREGK